MAMTDAGTRVGRRIAPRTGRLWGGLAGLAAVVFIVASPLPGMAAMSTDAISAKIATEFGVEVLRVRSAIGPDGQDIYRVTVMNPGGTRNNAFAVTTLEVDALSGDLVPQYRHTPNGMTTGAGGRLVPNRHGPEAVRPGSWR